MLSIVSVGRVAMNEHGGTMNRDYNIKALDIDAEEKETIRTTDGPVLIITGPGTVNRFAERRAG